jgi:hypothetical protein
MKIIFKTLGHLKLYDMMHLCIQSQTKFFIMKSNEELQKNVVDAINWEPLLNAAEIESW